MALNNPPRICLSEPVLPIRAGTAVVATINGASRRCRADLQFADTTYLPLSWTFDSISCIGEETASFTIPEGVPNGDAYITWDCAGDTTLSCIHVKLSDGSANLDSTSVQQIGVVKCQAESATTLITKRSKSSANGGIPTPTPNKPQSDDATGSIPSGVFVTTPTDTSMPHNPATDTTASPTPPTVTGPQSLTGQVPTTTTPSTNASQLPASTEASNQDTATQPHSTTDLKAAPTTNAAKTLVMTTTVNVCSPNAHT